MTEFWCEHAWLGGEEAYPGVVIGVEGERIVTVRVGVAEAPERCARRVRRWLKVCCAAGCGWTSVLSVLSISTLAAHAA